MKIFEHFDKLLSKLSRKHGTAATRKQKYIFTLKDFERVQRELQRDSIVFFSNAAFIPFLIGGGAIVEKAQHGGFIARTETTK